MREGVALSEQMDLFDAEEIRLERLCEAAGVWATSTRDLLERCPTCGVERGELCVRRDGRVRSVSNRNTHGARSALATCREFSGGWTPEPGEMILAGAYCEMPELCGSVRFVEWTDKGEAWWGAGGALIEHEAVREGDRIVDGRRERIVVGMERSVFAPCNLRPLPKKVDSKSLP